MDHITKGAFNNSDNYIKERLGNMYVLPSTFIGSPRYMNLNYQKAMTIVRKKGRPDLFITMTFNPNWPEIKRIVTKFRPGTTCNDIANICVRLFYIKCRAILSDIISGKVFGYVISWFWVVEFQKRGLPHIHMMFTLDPKPKLSNPEDIDKIISAEIPEDDSELKELVFKHMLDGPHSDETPC